MEKKASKIDGFLYLAFNFGKFISILFLGILLIIFSLAVFWLFRINQADVNVPQFAVIKAQAQNVSSFKELSEDSNYDAINKRQEIENKYGNTIKKIIEKNSADPSLYDALVKKIVETRDDLRKSYIDGFSSFLSDALKYGTESGMDIDQEKVLNIYDAMFSDMLIEQESNKQRDWIEKLQALSIIFASTLLFIAFLILPVLIKIEENTRA